MVSDHTQLPQSILFVAHDAHLGGAQLSLVDTASALIGAGVEVHVQVPETPTIGLLVALLEGVGATVHHAPVGLWVQPPGGPETSLRRSTADVLRSLRRTSQLVRRLRVDLVISNTGLPAAGALAARLCGTPHVWWLHERQERGDPLVREFPLSFIRAVMRATGPVVVPSAFLAAEAMTWMPPDRVHVTVPVISRRRVLTEQELQLTTSTALSRVLFPGGLLPVKRPRVAALAMAELADDAQGLVLEIVGHDGPERDAVEDVAQIVRPGGIRIRGFVPSLMPELTPGTVLVSCGTEETFGRVLVEAMAAGIPVVAARAGASIEVIRHGETGLLFNPDDPSDLAHCLRRLTKDDALRSRLVRSAHEEAHSRWSAGDHLEELRRLWSLLGPQSP